MAVSASNNPILAPGVRGLPPSATLAINERSNALIASGRKVYKFGLGQSPFPVPDTVIAALRRAAPEKDYLPVRGLRGLQESFAAYLERQIGVKRPAAQVLVGPGSKELMFIASWRATPSCCYPARPGFPTCLRPKSSAGPTIGCRPNKPMAGNCARPRWRPIARPNRV